MALKPMTHTLSWTVCVPKAHHKYIVEEESAYVVSLEYGSKRSAPTKALNLPSSNEVDLNEPATKKQKIQETDVVTPTTSLFVILSSVDWEIKRAEKLAKGEHKYSVSPQFIP